MSKHAGGRAKVAGKKTAMRRAAPLALSMSVVCAAFAAPSAFAAPPASPAPSPPRLSAVTAIAFPALPELAAAPAEIPAGERVDGLAFVPVFWGGNHIGIRAEDGKCLRGPLDWTDAPDKPLSTIAISVRTFARVLPVRTERLVRSEDGSAALEVQDVWIDGRTRAARVHATARLPLTRLGAGPVGLPVYAARAGAALHVVVPTEHRGVTLDDQGGFRHVECQHVRVALEPPGPGGGTMAQVSALAPSTPAPIPFDEKPGQLRPFTITASLTQLSRDPEPVVSVRVAWARTPSFTPPPPMPQIAPPSSPQISLQPASIR